MKNDASNKLCHKTDKKVTEISEQIWNLQQVWHCQPHLLLEYFELFTVQYPLMFKDKVKGLFQRQLRKEGATTGPTSGLAIKPGWANC